MIEVLQLKRQMLTCGKGSLCDHCYTNLEKMYYFCSYKVRTKLQNLTRVLLFNITFLGNRQCCQAFYYYNISIL